MHNLHDLNSQPLKALDTLGGEPLADSGFETEAAEPEFSETAAEEAN